MPQNDGGTSQVEYHDSVVYPRLRIAERVWQPAKLPNAALVIAHGGTWHGGWFGELGDKLCSQSEATIRVSCADHLSHGLSDDVETNMRGYVPNFADIVKELGAAIKRARAAIGESKPIFLLGESMGGLAVLSGLTEQVVSDVEGIILCGALIEFSPALKPPRFLIPLFKFAATIYPTMPIPLPIGGETFDRAFGSSEAAKFAREDPLVCDTALPRVGMISSTLDALFRVHRNGPEKINVKSILFMHYTKDERTDYAEARCIVESFEKVQDKVMHPVEGTAHQLFQDVPEKTSQHIQTVVDFLLYRIN